jgi:hypothetical protein
MRCAEEVSVCDVRRKCQCAVCGGSVSVLCAEEVSVCGGSVSVRRKCQCAVCGGSVSVRCAEAVLVCGVQSKC